MDGFYDRIRHPAMTDVQIDWGGLQVSDIFAARVPDLFVGRPVILTGRFEGQVGTGPILAHGRAGGKSLTIPVPVTHLTQASTDQPPTTSERLVNRPSALSSVWARRKITALSDQSLHGEARDVGAVAASIKKVALDYNLLSAYTAFVAVDAARTTFGDRVVVTPVAVPLPVGVEGEPVETEKGESENK